MDKNDDLKYAELISQNTLETGNIDNQQFWSDVRAYLKTTRPAPDLEVYWDEETSKEIRSYKQRHKIGDETDIDEDDAEQKVFKFYNMTVKSTTVVPLEDKKGGEWTIIGGMLIKQIPERLTLIDKKKKEHDAKYKREKNFWKQLQLKADTSTQQKVIEVLETLA